MSGSSHSGLTEISRLLTAKRNAILSRTRFRNHRIAMQGMLESDISAFIYTPAAQDSDRRLTKLSRGAQMKQHVAMPALADLADLPGLQRTGQTEVWQRSAHAWTQDSKTASSQRRVEDGFW